MESRDHLERTNRELLLLNALWSAISASLDTRAILNRARAVLAEVTGDGGVCFFMLRPHPEATFDASEGLDETISLVNSAGNRTGAPVIPSRTLAHPSWRRLLMKGEIESHVLASRGDAYPELQPLWDRAPDARVWLVPVWGQSRPIAVLILTESPQDEDSVLGAELLSTVSSQLGTAMENAWLFQEARAAFDTLNEAKSQLVHAEKFAAVGLLASEVAHEINNPATFVITNMSVMSEYVDMVQMFHDAVRERIAEKGSVEVDDFEALVGEHEIEFLHEDLKKLVERSLAGMERIHHIVRDLRFMTHQKATDAGWIDLDRLLESSVNLVAHEAKYRTRIELELDSAPMIRTDPNRLSQVLLNLLVNAVQSIPPGDVDAHCVTIRSGKRGDMAFVEVEDTGAGIEGDQLERIFEPFFTTKEPGSGTGLGLSISRDIIRGLGGDIAVSSAPGTGSTFTVTLPIDANQKAESREITERRDDGDVVSDG